MDTGRHSLRKRPRQPQSRSHVVPLRGGRQRAPRHRPGAREATCRARGPAWTLLYALLPLSALLLALAECIPANDGWRRLAEALVAVVGVGLAWIWVRANRGALSRLTSDPGMDTESHQLRVEIQKASPQVIPLMPRRSGTEN